MTSQHRSRRVVGASATAAVLATVLSAFAAAAPVTAATLPAPDATGKVASIAALVPASYASKGTLSVAVATYPPSAIDPGDGSPLTGWDVENTRAILKVLGLQGDFKVMSFDGVVPGLQSNRYDLATGEIYIKPERTAVVTFVANHVSQDALLVSVNSKLKTAKTMGALCGKVLTATLGSAEMDLANQVVTYCAKQHKAKTTVKTFQTAAAMNLALTSHRVDAEIGSASQVAYVAQQTGRKFRTIAVPWSTSFDTGLAIARTTDSNQFAKAVAAATDYLIANGTLKKILNKWNGGLGLIAKAKIEPPIA